MGIGRIFRENYWSAKLALPKYMSKASLALLKGYFIRGETP
jgi:hypothetical protein